MLYLQTYLRLLIASNELLIAKLNAYGFSLPALRLIHDYLSRRKQRTRVNNSYSKWLAVMFAVML